MEVRKSKRSREPGRVESSSLRFMPPSPSLPSPAQRHRRKAHLEAHLGVRQHNGARIPAQLAPRSGGLLTRYYREPSQVKARPSRGGHDARMSNLEKKTAAAASSLAAAAATYAYLEALEMAGPQGLRGSPAPPHRAQQPALAHFLASAAPTTPAWCAAGLSAMQAVISTDTEARGAPSASANSWGLPMGATVGRPTAYGNQIAKQQEAGASSHSMQMFQRSLIGEPGQSGSFVQGSPPPPGPSVPTLLPLLPSPLSPHPPIHHQSTRARGAPFRCFPRTSPRAVPSPRPPPRRLRAVRPAQPLRPCRS